MRSEPQFAGPPDPSWPERLQQLSARWHGPLVPAERERIRAEIWTLLVGALYLKTRRQVGRHGAVEPDLAYDLAVDRTLDLFSRFARDQWDPRASSAAQLQSYFTLLARNGLIDYLRSRVGKMRSRERRLELDTDVAVTIVADELAADRALLARTLEQCAGRLTRRARTIWYLRIFHDLSSRRIASHPDVRMSVAAVDMALTRARRTVQACLREHGFGRSDFGTGTFTACWNAFRREGGLTENDQEVEKSS